ncbi:MAG: type 4a pilus biogenesis protein PilO [Firmicutes bacterium]|nr:type 4a pilus biogenesis protein PilO [Bacillota bacterium]
MAKKNNLLRLVVGGLIYLVVTGGALVAGYNYHGRSREYAVIVMEREFELAMVRRRVEEDLPRLKEEYNRYYERAKDLRRFTPTREEQERMVVSIEQLAKSAGIQIHSCQMADEPRPVEEMPAYQVYTWEIFCSGRYPQMDRFLTLLDRADRLMKVDELNVRARSEQDDPGAYILDIDLQLDLIVRMGG